MNSRTTTAALASFLALAMSAHAQTPAPAEAPPAPPAAPAAPAEAAPAPAAAAEAPVNPRTRYAATFNFVGGDRERRALEVAIERATDGMSFITRPFANGRLRDRNPVYANIVFRFPEGAIETVLAGRTFRSPDNGGAAQGQSITGEPVRINQRFENQRLVQTLTTDAGSRRTEFILSADGNTLTMRVTLTSSSIPRPLRYDLTYRR